MFFHNTGAAKSIFFNTSVKKWDSKTYKTTLIEPHQQQFLLHMGVKVHSRLSDFSHELKDSINNRSYSEILSPGLEPFNLFSMFHLVHRIGKI